MKYFSLLKLLFISLMLAVIFSTANGQAANSGINTQENQVDPQTRAEVLRELGLSKEQIQQIRRINAERKPVMQESRRRLDEANAELDKAVYNKADESEIQARLKEVQAAHAEVIKNRTMSEAAISKVLTPAQLSRFREFQQKFNEQKRLEKTQNRQNQESLKQGQNPNRVKNIPQKTNKIKDIQQNRFPRRRKQLFN